jgi:hypothetical protein
MADPEGAFGTDFGHGGDGPGYSVCAGCHLDFCGRRVSTAVFCNGDEMDARALRHDLLAALRPELGETFTLV